MVNQLGKLFFEHIIKRTYFNSLFKYYMRWFIDHQCYSQKNFAFHDFSSRKLFLYISYSNSVLSIPLSHRKHSQFRLNYWHVFSLIAFGESLFTSESKIVWISNNSLKLFPFFLSLSLSAILILLWKRIYGP